MKKCKKLLVMMLVLSLILTTGLATGVVQAEGTTTQLAPALGKTPGNSNPLITQKYGADPFAMVYKGRVYIYLTDDQAQWELTPETANSYSNCRSISIISSADMVNWTDHGKVPVGGRVLADGVAKWATNAWAPAATWRTIDGKDKFFLYFADNGSGVGVLEADSPVGPFHDPIGKQLISRSTPNCSSSTIPWLFDPAVLVDDKDYDNDGVNDAFLYFGGGIDGLSANNPKSARCVQLGNDMISIVGTPAAIDAPRLFEDSGIHKFNGKYYYSYCSNFSGTNGDGYPPTGTIAYMESDKPLGPFTYVGPILPGPGTFGNGDSGNNHHAIFQFGDNWYITYHTRQVNIAQRLANGQTGQKDYRSPSVSQLSIATTGAITPLQMENKGIDQLQNISPYDPTEAETIGWMGGINTEVCTEPSMTGSTVNMDVTSINNGDWIALGKADFGTGASSFSAKVACGTAGGTIELHLDSADGTLIGTLPVNYTGGENVWQNEITNVTGATGIHDLYMVFKGAGTSNLFKMDSWQFAQKSAKQLAGINATIDKLKIDTKTGNNTANMVVSAIYTDGTSENVTSQATITPSQNGIVSISNGVVTGTSYGAISLDVSYSGKSDKLNLIVKDLDSELKAKSITVDKASLALEAGNTATYKVTAEYYDGHTEDVTNLVTIDNPNPNVATVANGNVTAATSGAIDVTLSYKGQIGDTVTAKISITVNVPAIVAIEAETAAANTADAFVSGTSSNGYTWALVDGQSTKAMMASPGDSKPVNTGTDATSLAKDTKLGFNVNFPASGTYNVWALCKTKGDYNSDSIHVGLDNGYKFTTNGITGVTGANWKWANLSTISGGATLNVTAGVHEIDFWARESGLSIDRILLTTSTSTADPVWPSANVAVTGVTMSNTSLDLSVGENAQLTATVAPADATNKTITWSTSNSNVATVDNTGKVTAVTAGTATITVTTADGNKTATCNVTVKSASTQPFEIKNAVITREGGVVASITVSPTIGVTPHVGKEVVVFQLMKGNTPVSIVALQKDVTSAEGFKAYFNVDPNDTTYVVRAFVIDTFNNDLNSAPISLADSVSMSNSVQ